MRISERSRTDFDKAKIKLTGHFDRRPISRYFEPLYGCTLRDIHLFSFKERGWYDNVKTTRTTTTTALQRQSKKQRDIE